MAYAGMTDGNCANKCAQMFEPGRSGKLIRNKLDTTNKVHTAIISIKGVSFSCPILLLIVSLEAVPLYSEAGEANMAFKSIKWRKSLEGSVRTWKTFKTNARIEALSQESFLWAWFVIVLRPVRCRPQMNVVSEGTYLNNISSHRSWVFVMCSLMTSLELGQTSQQHERQLQHSSERSMGILLLLGQEPSPLQETSSA